MHSQLKLQFKSNVPKFHRLRSENLPDSLDGDGLFAAEQRKVCKARHLRTAQERRRRASKSTEDEEKAKSLGFEKNAPFVWMMIIRVWKGDKEN